MQLIMLLLAHFYWILCHAYINVNIEVSCLKLFTLCWPTILDSFLLFRGTLLGSTITEFDFINYNVKLSVVLSVSSFKLLN